MAKNEPFFTQNCYGEPNLCSKLLSLVPTHIHYLGLHAGLQSKFTETLNFRLNLPGGPGQGSQARASRQRPQATAHRPGPLGQDPQDRVSRPPGFARASRVGPPGQGLQSCRPPSTQAWASRLGFLGQAKVSKQEPPSQSPSQQIQ